MVSASWFEHDLPVLNLVIAAADLGEPADLPFVSEALALDAHTAAVVIDRLTDAGYLAAAAAATPTTNRQILPTPMGRRATASLPPPAPTTR